MSLGLSYLVTWKSVDVMKSWKVFNGGRGLERGKLVVASLVQKVNLLTASIELDEKIAGKVPS